MYYQVLTFFLLATVSRWTSIQGMIPEALLTSGSSWTPMAQTRTRASSMIPTTKANPLKRLMPPPIVSVKGPQFSPKMMASMRNNLNPVIGADNRGKMKIKEEHLSKEIRFKLMDAMNEHFWTNSPIGEEAATGEVVLDAAMSHVVVKYTAESNQYSRSVLPHLIDSERSTFKLHVIKVTAVWSAQFPDFEAYGSVEIVIDPNEPILVEFKTEHRDENSGQRTISAKWISLSTTVNALGHYIEKDGEVIFDLDLLDVITAKVQAAIKSSVSTVIVKIIYQAAALIGHETGTIRNAPEEPSPLPAPGSYDLRWKFLTDLYRHVM